MFTPAHFIWLGAIAAAVTVVLILTKKLKELSIIHGINLLDHVIIGQDNYFSFYDNNLL